MMDEWEGGWEAEGDWAHCFGEAAESSLNPLQQISALQWHPLCVVYIYRIGSALHANKILLLIISAAQKSANQSDEDNKTGRVARTP